MKILRARVNWFDDFDNAPQLEVWIDALPHDQVRYEQRGHLYFGESDGYVSFFSYRGPDEGYGGREFTLTMKDGSTQILKGPWSSNPDSMAAAGFPMTYDVALICPATWNPETEAHYGGQLTEARFLEAFEFVKDEAHLIATEHYAPYNDTCSSEQNVAIEFGLPPRAGAKIVRSYQIARKGMTFPQSQAYKRALRLRKYYYEGDWTPWIFWGADKDREEKQENRDKMAAHVNEIIREHNLEEHGVTPITELLPVPEPKHRPIEHYYDPESDPEDYAPDEEVVKVEI
jgi:hypothetical protein